MQTYMLTKARNNFKHLSHDPELMRAHIRKWTHAMRILGDKWLLAKPVERKQ